MTCPAWQDVSSQLWLLRPPWDSGATSVGLVHGSWGGGGLGRSPAHLVLLALPPPLCQP